jgi:CotH kinase protein/HYR domain/Domain of unknown function DUF11/Chitobiase/beta-hexosaminidase C-terminal domain/Divergent InlB B-repeat domain/Secretion system C-terminal sorting domain
MNFTSTQRSWVFALFLLPVILTAQTQVAQPTVSTVGGKYDTGFPLSISTTTPNTNIFYTLDGNEPTESAMRYTSPISIDKNTTLRIKGFVAGMTPSQTTTHSYFINTTHTFPIVALSFKKSDFFNDTTGIYVKYENDLEAPANIELFESGAKTAAFNQMVGIEIQGSASAQLPQKSLEIKASSAYSAVPYKVFPELTFTSYKRFVLRNGGQDWGITLFRDELATSLALKTADLNGIIRKPDLDMQDFRPSVVYFNGEYWGIHGIRERMNRFYVEQHYNLKSADYDMIENWGGEVNNGDATAFTTFYNSLPSRNLANNTTFEQFKTELDVSNFLDYNVFNIFIDNTDWPSNNIRCFRIKAGGKWRFINYDHDFSFGLFLLNGGWNTGDARQNALSRLFNATDINWPNGANATLLFRKCMENGNFRRDFINRMADMMNTVFKPTRISQRINEFKTQYQPEIERHAVRWGAPYGILWQANIEKMRSFGNQRIPEVMNHVQQQFSEVTGTASVTVAVMPVNGGSVNFSTLNLPPSVLPFTGTYFTGVDIPVTAVPAVGYVFRGWSDASLGNSSTINVRLSAAKNLTAIFELSSPCSADNQKPIFQSCPSNITLTTAQNCATATWAAPIATDNCTLTPSVSSNFASGFCFPLGSTTVVYTARDNVGNSSICQFTVQVNQQVTTGSCKRYSVTDVNNFCGCSAQQWLPYAILLDPVANSSNCLGTRITAQFVDFQQNTDGTATLKGTFRDGSWTPIVIDIKLSGGTSTPPAGAPFRNFCMQSQPLSATSGWFYYPQMTGTYKFGANPSLPITLSNTPFEVGIGANQQRIELLGASAKFTVGGISTGQFNFLLNNEQTISCSTGSTPCDTDSQPPVLSNCPQNIALTATQNCATASWTAPTATDNCTTPPSVSANFSSGFCFPIGTTTVVYTASDARNNKTTCDFNVVVVQGNTTSTADLALSLTTNQPTYVKYTVINLQIVAKNAGNQLLTNIKTKFNYPLGTVFGGTPTPSVGTWNAYCGRIECNEWTIPSLAEGATATLTVPLYVINTATTINALARLLTTTPTDQNTTNNQANLSIPPRTTISAAAVQKASYQIPIVIQKISPNPTTDGAINVDLESISEREVTFEFYNTLGKTLKTEVRKVESGRNKLFFDVLDLETGVYFIIPTTKSGRHVPTKFVKM